MSVAATGLRKTFAGVTALDGVDIRIEPGRIHALLGANGSGKSTLVKLLCGVHRPDGGSLRIGAETRAEIASPHEAARLGIAVVHQEAPLVDTLSVAECIALFRGYPARAGRVLWARLHDETRAMLARFDVAIDPRRPAGTLGPAERAIVALTIALDRVRTGLNLLILDEVTAALPEDQAAAFLDRVGAIAAGGTAVLMVTHRLRELHGRADDVTVLRDGRVVHAASEGAADDGALIALMVGTRATPAPEAAAPGGAVRRLWGEAGRQGAARALEVAHLAGGFLRDASFHVERGEIVGVAGLVESGITELPELLGGTAPRRAGRIAVAGQELPARATPADAIAAGLALLPADRLRAGGIATLSVADNALLPEYRRYWHAKAREAAVLGRLIGELDVRPPDAAARFGGLSGGNQQKVLLGKWLLLRPAVMVLDDPTTGVDPNARATIFAMLRDAAREGIGMLLLSTEPEQLAAMCSRVLVLRGGGVAAELRGAELTHASISRWCYA